MGWGPLGVLAGDPVGWVGGLGPLFASIRGGLDGFSAAWYECCYTTGDEGIKCFSGKGAEAFDLELPSASTKFWRIALFSSV
jgi:hypothetical protein